MNKVTRAWKVYGVEGHRQRESFCNSYKHDFSNERDGIRIIEVFNSDKTGTNEYTIVRITRNTFGECERELDGQITDGIFENSRTGIVEEITDNEVEHWTMDTFGSMLPANWEEICEAANDYMDENGYTNEDSAELWERWCNEDADILRLIPRAVFEQKKVRFVVKYIDPKTGATSPIDNIEEREDYTAEDYIADCEINADEDWCEMLHEGEVVLEKVEEVEA